MDDLGDAALREAEAHDKAMSAGGPTGPLHGVPVTIKENVDQRGCATPNGVVAFKDVIAPDDAPVVRNLRRAGAIIVGRTNTPEFSFRGTTVNELHGRTFNPWNATASAGGSSGGAAAGGDDGLWPDRPRQRHRRLAPLSGLRLRRGHSEARARPGAGLQSLGRRRARHAGAGDVRAGRDLPRGPRRAPGHALARRLRPARSLAGVHAVRGAARAAAHQGRLHPEHLRLPPAPAVARALDTARTALAAAGYDVREVEPPLLKEAAVTGARASSARPRR